jgi:ergothioneine biosynthesis protein EgtB
MQAIRSGEVPGTGLRELFTDVRAQTETLCEPLEIEDYVPQPVVDVSPVKWNIAHTTWFFERMILQKYLPEYKPFNESYNFLFNSYYNSIGARTVRNHRGDLSRPTVKEIFDYRQYVDQNMTDLLLRPDLSPEVLELLVLGINHEQQHQELLLTDLKYTFGVNPLFPAYRPDFSPEDESAKKVGRFLEFDAHEALIGHSSDGFCFDNELAPHKVFLDRYSISPDLVTNGEYAAFIEDGGYRDFRLWHSDGWDWVNQNGLSAPLYWHRRDDEWFHFTLAGLKKLPADAPVCHVSFYEAAAFAEWRGCRLPTEFEWEAASDKFEWGKRWEWTNSAYLPYPGFKKAAGAVGEYNGKFMINQMVLRGASVATPKGHSRKTYRNFFQPHLSWQFTGIRLAK